MCVVYAHMKRISFVNLLAVCFYSISFSRRKQNDQFHVMWWMPRHAVCGVYFSFQKRLKIYNNSVK